jgi:hypothetical protein
MELEAKIRRRRAIMHACIVLALLLGLFPAMRLFQGVSAVLTIVMYFALLNVFPEERLKARLGHTNLVLGRWATEQPSHTYQRFAEWCGQRIENRQRGWRLLVRLFGELPPGP